MDNQTIAFQALKPICVALGEAAKSLNEGKAKLATVTAQLEKLKQTLTSYSTRPNALHPSLAEYVFFPISQVLRVSQKVSIQCLELSLQCISILIDQGWRQHLPAQTAAQLLILCTLLADRKPQGLPFAETTEDLQASALWCLYHIFSVAGDNAETRRLLITETQFPQLGKTISTILDAIDDPSRNVSQVAASSSLEALLIHVADRGIHATFLPGIVSKLTKTLTPSTKGRTSPQVLLHCLSVIQLLLKSTLADGAESEALGFHSSPRRLAPRAILIDDSWQTNAATQLRPALLSIMRLRSHVDPEVRKRLGRLCLTILRPCRAALSNCSSFALETLVTVSIDDRNSSMSMEFEILLRGDTSIASTLQQMLHEWLQSLSTRMQSADEQVKLGKMRQVRASYELLAQAGVDMTSIDRIAADALRDSVVVTLTVTGAHQQAISDSPQLQSLDLVILDERREITKFDSPLIKYKGQQKVMEAMEEFTVTIVDHGSPSELRNKMARSLRQTDGDALVSIFWLLLTACERDSKRHGEEDALLNLPDEFSYSSTEALEELYSFALTVLTKETDRLQDPRLQALALRALALRARMEGLDFRFELLDALYPVLHTLATPDEMLQRASIATLNALTSSCGYVSVRDLIVDNVDYLTNAVALKLNAFDVSPQAPQVLLMMLRLAGPTLLPYLEDTVDSIFAALEDYHGYPLLVELLFRVLGVMAEEGVKIPQLAIEAGENARQRNDEYGENWGPTTVNGLAKQLQMRAEDELEVERRASIERESHPERPWSKPDDSHEAGEMDILDDGDQDRSLDDGQVPPPAPRTYSLLLKITELTQHFLPSASTSLRTSLLGLIRTTAPALAKHENSFLPLINTLWPEVVSRLDDEEVHIMATALDIVRVLCECAGGFMRTRIIHLWVRLMEIYQNVAKDIIQSESVSHRASESDRARGASVAVDDARLKQALVRMDNKSPSDCANASTRLMWSALQGLIPAIVKHVRMPPEYIDEALRMTAPMLGQQKVRSAFEGENSDAVWLALVKVKLLDTPRTPEVPRHRAWRFAVVAG